MPFPIEKHGDEYWVVSEGSGKVHGKFKTLKEAHAQQRAIYANYKGADPTRSKREES